MSHAQVRDQERMSNVRVRCLGQIIWLRCLGQMSGSDISFRFQSKMLGPDIRVKFQGHMLSEMSGPCYPWNVSDLVNTTLVYFYYSRYITPGLVVPPAGFLINFIGLFTSIPTIFGLLCKILKKSGVLCEALQPFDEVLNEEKKLKEHNSCFGKSMELLAFIFNVILKGGKICIPAIFLSMDLFISNCVGLEVRGVKNLILVIKYPKISYNLLTDIILGPMGSLQDFRLRPRVVCFKSCKIALYRRVDF